MSWSELCSEDSDSKSVTSETNKQANDWQIAKNNKRSRTSPEKPHQKNKQKKLDNYWLATPNRFEILDEEYKAQESTNKAKEPKIPKPPPIFVAGVGNILPLRELLNEIAPEKYYFKILPTNEVKIQPSSADVYSLITKALAEKKTEFHTYKLKQERSFNVVLKGMHHSIPTAEIKEAIEQLGFEVVNITNIRQRTTKNPLPLFFVGLKSTESVKKIFDCDNLLHTKIVFEPPRKKRELPQCTRCQRYGHTKHYCNRVPRCVKCPENHFTTECPRKGTNSDVRCVLCDGNHPANYKGCTVYKQLQQKMFPPLRKKEAPRKPTQPTQPTQQFVEDGRTFADAVKNKGSNPQATENSDMSDLKLMLKTLMEQMSTMLNLLSAFVTNNSK